MAARHGRPTQPPYAGVDSGGYVYVADLNNGRVRRIGPDGVITTVAGNGIRGSSGDGGAATSAPLLTPRNVVVDAVGNLYFSEFSGHRVRKVSPDGKISTVAGTGVAGSAATAPGYQRATRLSAGLAVDRLGALYIADSLKPSGAQNPRRRHHFDRSGWFSGYRARDPRSRCRGHSRHALCRRHQLRQRSFLHGCRSVDHRAGTVRPPRSGRGSERVLYIADGTRIRKAAPGQMQTVAGDGYLHALGDGGLATDALLLQPSAIALNGAGSLYVPTPAPSACARCCPPA